MASPNAMIPAPALPILRFRVSSKRTLGGLGTVRGRCARATFGRRQSRGRGQRAAQVGRCLLPQDPTSFELPSVMSVMEHALFPLFPPALRGPFRLIMRTTFLYGNINPHFDENMLFQRVESSLNGLVASKAGGASQSLRAWSQGDRAV